MASTNLNFRVSPELKRRIEAHAKRQRRSLAATIRVMIEDTLDEAEAGEERRRALLMGDPA